MADVGLQVRKFQSTYFLEDMTQSSKVHWILYIMLLARALVLTFRNPSDPGGGCPDDPLTTRGLEEQLPKLL